MNDRYFAYGSNMNAERMRERGLGVVRREGARLAGVRLGFDKGSGAHPGAGHACLIHDPTAEVEGILYWLESVDEIRKLDRFENTPINYSRELVRVTTASGPVDCWTYFANPAVLQPGLRPPRSYLRHLLEGRSELSAEYHARLQAWPCADDAAAAGAVDAPE